MSKACKNVGCVAINFQLSTGRHKQEDPWNSQVPLLLQEFQYPSYACPVVCIFLSRGPFPCEMVNLCPGLFRKTRPSCLKQPLLLSMMSLFVVKRGKAVFYLLLYGVEIITYISKKKFSHDSVFFSLPISGVFCYLRTLGIGCH